MPMDFDPASRRERLEDWRDRLLANPRFQRWASGFPLTRGIARSRQKQLFDICAGFVHAQVMDACVRLHLFEALARRPHTTQELAEFMALTEPAADRLLRAAAGLNLARRRSGGRWGLGSLGAALVGNPGVAAMVRHHSMLYQDLADPVALLRGEAPPTKLATFWPYAGRRNDDVPPEGVAAYSALMSASQHLVAEDLLDAWPLSDRGCVLDVGGGDGSFLVEVARSAPDTRLMLFDLPAVADLARDRFAAERLDNRAQAVGGDVLRDPLPEGADVATLIRVLHDHEDAAALEILKAIRRVLPPKGVLLVAEPMSGTRGGESIADSYFGFYLLSMGSGRCRTAEELEALIQRAGFTLVREVPMRRPLMARLLVAQGLSPERDVNQT